MNVHVDYADECRQNDLGGRISAIRQNLKTKKYGVSIDIDAFDPTFAPGTGTIEPDGLNPNDLMSFLSDIASDEQFIALEIMEFNPDKDENNQTLDWIIRFIEATMMNSTSIHEKEKG
jgi:arginase